MVNFVTKDDKPELLQPLVDHISASFPQLVCSMDHWWQISACQRHCFCFFLCFIKFWSYKFPSLCVCLDIGMKFWAMTVKQRGVGHVGEHCEQCKYINRTFIGG
jgi:hypothetical protein